MEISDAHLPTEPERLQELIVLFWQAQEYLIRDYEAKARYSQKNYEESIQRTQENHAEAVRRAEKNHQEEICRIQAELADFKHRLQKELHYRYGKHSEKRTDKGNGVFDEAKPLSDAEEGEIEQRDAALSKKKSPPRQRRSGLPKDLPREQVIHDLADAEKFCSRGQSLHRIGEDISEKLEFVPAQVRVIQHVRCKYACRHCEGGVQVARLPLQAIPKSVTSTGLLSYIITSKYEDHIPLYRQESILQRMGIDLVRSTLCFWALKCADLLEPLVHLLRPMINQGRYTQVDETPLQVLVEPNKTTSSKVIVRATTPFIV